MFSTVENWLGLATTFITLVSAPAAWLSSAGSLRRLERLTALYQGMPPGQARDEIARLITIRAQGVTRGYFSRRLGVFASLFLALSLITVVVLIYTYASNLSDGAVPSAVAFVVFVEYVAASAGAIASVFLIGLAQGGLRQRKQGWEQIAKLEPSSARPQPWKE